MEERLVRRKAQAKYPPVPLSFGGVNPHDFCKAIPVSAAELEYMQMSPFERYEDRYDKVRNSLLAKSLIEPRGDAFYLTRYGRMYLRYAASKR